MNRKVEEWNVNEQKGGGMGNGLTERWRNGKWMNRKVEEWEMDEQKGG